MVKHDPDVNPQSVKPKHAPIAVKTVPMDGVPAGYYVIIGVYANGRNAYTFREQMSKRYEVGTFVNKVNALTYVYMGKGALSLEEAQNLMHKWMYHADFIGGIWVLEVN